eukprot:g3015.t1
MPSWSCPKCTFVNESGTACGVCGAARTTDLTVKQQNKKSVAITTAQSFFENGDWKNVVSKTVSNHSALFLPLSSHGASLAEEKVKDYKHEQYNVWRLFVEQIEVCLETLLEKHGISEQEFFDICQAYINEETMISADEKASMQIIMNFLTSIFDYEKFVQLMTEKSLQLKAWREKEKQRDLEVRSGSHSWQCGICSFINGTEGDACTMCGAERSSGHTLSSGMMIDANTLSSQSLNNNGSTTKSTNSNVDSQLSYEIQFGNSSALQHALDDVNYPLEKLSMKEILFIMPEKAKENIASLFDQLDRNREDTILRNEFVKFMVKYDLSKEEINDLFDFIATEDTEKITRPDFFMWFIKPFKKDRHSFDLTLCGAGSTDMVKTKELSVRTHKARIRIGVENDIFFGFSFQTWRQNERLVLERANEWTPIEVALYLASAKELEYIRSCLNREAFVHVDGETFLDLNRNNLESKGIPSEHHSKFMRSIRHLRRLVRERCIRDNVEVPEWYGEKTFKSEKLEGTIDEETLAHVERMLTDSARGSVGFDSKARHELAEQIISISLQSPQAKAVLSGRRKSRDYGDGTTMEIRNWRKGQKIGSGGFGTVFLAMNIEDGSYFALKEVNVSKSASRNQFKLLEAEINLMKSLKHKNIVTYLGSRNEKRKFFIYSEWCPGGSLYAVLNRFGKLPPHVNQLYTTQILRGLVYLHSQDVLHLDVKPHNILVDDLGTIKLSDFGCSERLRLGEDSKGGVKGTPAYMAPEVIKEGKYTTKADIWSLGCTVLHMATGEVPWHEFKAKNPSTLMFHIVEAKLPPSIGEGLHESTRSFIESCCLLAYTERPEAKTLLKEHEFIAKEVQITPLQSGEVVLPDKINTSVVDEGQGIQRTLSGASMKGSSGDNADGWEMLSSITSFIQNETPAALLKRAEEQRMEKKKEKGQEKRKNNPFAKDHKYNSKDVQKKCAAKSNSEKPRMFPTPPKSLKELSLNRAGSTPW